MRVWNQFTTELVVTHKEITLVKPETVAEADIGISISDGGPHEWQRPVTGIKHSDRMTEEDTVDQSKKKGLFGLEKIQCFRRSFLTGISGGLGCGAVYFLCTSNTKRLLPVSVSSYAVITLGTWILCRYQRASERIKAREYRQVLGLQNIIITKDSRKT